MKPLLDIIGLLVCVYVMAALVGSWIVLHAVRRRSKFTPQGYELPWRSIRFPSGDHKILLSGWLITHESNSNGLVILCHDYRGNKSDLLPMAVFLFRNNFDCLLFDFRAHGESQGYWSTLGLREANDLKGALQLVQDSGLTSDGKVIVWGLGMGGCAALLAAPQVDQVKAWLCEGSYYSGFEWVEQNYDAFFSPMPRFLFKKIGLCFMGFLSGIRVSGKWPIDVIHQINSPILFIHGEKDRLVSPEHSRTLFEACSSLEKHLWIVPGAEHAKCYATDSKTYQAFFFELLGVSSEPKSGGEDTSTDVAIAVIVDAGKVLMGRRLTRGELQGLWEFPGGKLKPEESPQLAVIREVREEVEAEVVVENLIATTEHKYSDAQVKLHFFKCRLHRGTPKPLAYAELKWVDKAELTRLQLPKANQAILEKVVALL